ncbi:S41 family peptidase [Bdellovibrio bacteriovorus]|uniref:Carboxyl-terminal protease n=1 Tax=Bdellovibrio bacteriovorus str. Tiberius TaxID=1069642 RepID=K7YQQ8_BDEBC|nr:S41 family peptidase [Bdellovibrio bacteriovorus]AFX99867.1 carboxyl-terminal protease [Bdellovibrio bacteriovorus str. Tiberius]
MQSLKRYWKTYILGGALLLVLFIMAETGFQVRAFAQERYADLQNFSKVLNLIQQYYVEEVNTKKLVYGAIKGMLRELDPHTNFMPPEMFKDFETETSGEFGGLGIEISIQNGILTIISPIEDAPAWEAGIKAGDKVVAIDGTTTKGMSLAEASVMMRGKKGSKIVLRVVRDNEDKPRDITVVRGSVKIKSVKYTDLGDGFAYVRITSFIENTSKDLQKVVETHIKNNKNMSGLLIDMRRNPGGLLDQAIKVSDMFLKQGTIVSTIGRNKNEKEVATASKKGQYTNFPIVILVNEYTASASEIVSGALQDNKRALIVGQRTFGKGSVQSVIKLGDGSGLKLTVARYYTPNGVSIQAEGIHPDIEIEDVDPDAFSKAIVKSVTTREGDIAGHLKGDREKAAEKLDVKEGAEEGALAWWKDVGSKKDEKLSPRDKLFKADYQAYQAFSYLKAWDTLKALTR